MSRRRRRLALEHQRTLALGLLALLSTGGLVGTELARVWRRGSAPLPAETEHVLGAAEEAARQTVEVAVTGYRHTSTRENALLNLLGSFSLTFVLARGLTHLIRRRGRVGPFGNVVVGRRHIHHFIPGIVLSLVTGGLAILSDDERLGRWLALPFGAGAALTLDESALLLEFDDVYWSAEGVLSVQITLGALGLVSSLALLARVLRRGEREVLEGAPA